MAALPLLCCCALLRGAAAERIGDYIRGNAELGTFAGHLNSSGVMQRLLEEEGPFTVFAPLNAAFDRWGPGVRLVVARRPERMHDLVNYHVVVGTPLFTDALPAAGKHAVSATTLAGLKLLVEVTINADQSPVVVVNGNATVTNGNQGPFSNGVVHLLDGVLSYPGWLPEGDLAAAVTKRRAQLGAFHAFLREAADALGLRQSGPLTLLAPTDAAMAKAGLCRLVKGPTGTTVVTVKLGKILPRDRDTLLRLLRFHVISGKILTAAELESGGSAPTLDAPSGQPNTISFQKVNDRIDLNLGGAKVDTLDNFATNGVLHTIDSVLVPPGVEIPDMEKSKADYRAQLMQASSTPAPPELSPADLQPLLGDSTKPTAEKLPVKLNEQQHTAAVALAALATVIVCGLLHRGRRGAGGPEDYDDGGKYGRKGGRRNLCRSGVVRGFCCIVTVGGILLVPLFSSTAWMLPPRLRTAAQGVRGVAVAEVQRRLRPPEKPRMTAVADPVADAVERAARWRLELEEMLNANNQTKPGTFDKLVQYGIDRIELLARADSADRRRLRLDEASWTAIVEEARKRSGWEPEAAQTPAPPAIAVGDTTKEEEERRRRNEEFERIAKEAQDVTSASTPPPKTTPPPPKTPPPTSPKAVLKPITTPVDPDAGKPKLVLGLLSVPFSGDETVECTLGNRHGKLETRDESVLEKVLLVSRSSMRTLEHDARPGSMPNAARNARLVMTTFIREPLSRVGLAFQAALGKPNEQTHFRCRGKLATVMSRPGFSLEEYARLPPQARALCESARNVMTKALADLPFDSVASQDTLEQAKQMLSRRLPVFMLHETLDRSMFALKRELGDPYSTYVPCAPHKEEHVPMSARATQVFSEENKLDLELFDHARHTFFTNWAGKYEDQFANPSCSPTPHVCFDEHDKNKEKKMKVPYANVQILTRGPIQKSVICAGKCDFPPPAPPQK